MRQESDHVRSDSSRSGGVIPRGVSHHEGGEGPMRRRTSRAPQQLCLICQILEYQIAQAERDLAEGRVEAVHDALRQMHAQISGVREGMDVARQAAR
jgi:hypothetical protein